MTSITNACCCHSNQTMTTQTHCAPKPIKEKAQSHSLLNSLALFGSFSTLFCCALPALLVTIGAGSVLVGLVSAVPQLVWISQHKILLFAFAGSMLTISGIARYRSRNAPCPTDAGKARSCSKMRKLSFGIWCFSLAMYVVGFFFAFIAQYLI